MVAKKAEMFIKLTDDIKLITKSLKTIKPTSTPSEKSTETSKFLTKISDAFEDWLEEVQNLLTEEENFLFAGIQVSCEFPKSVK
jgi:anion-transporting  ArsA/GET3 family ATPase